jgi:GntR family transcriptional regulator
MPSANLLNRAHAGVAQYTQLASILRHQILHGERQRGERLPTVVQLADDYRVARITARQAYGLLSAQGLVTTQRGRGTFVSGPFKAMDAGLRTAINDPRSQGVRFDILMQRRHVPLPEHLTRGAPTYPDYAYVKKIHRHDGEPFCLAEIHLASDIQARFPPGSEAHSKLAYLVNEYAPGSMHKVQQTMTVAPADLVLAQALGCSLATPMAHMVRRIFDVQGRLAMAGLFWYRGDRFVADMEIPYDIWLNYPGVVVPDVQPLIKATKNKKAPQAGL